MIDLCIVMCMQMKIETSGMSATGDLGKHTPEEVERAWAGVKDVLPTVNRQHCPVRQLGQECIFAGGIVANGGDVGTRADALQIYCVCPGAQGLRAARYGETPLDEPVKSRAFNTFLGNLESALARAF